MLAKNEIKFIQSLKQKKFRNQSVMFVAEGEKLLQHLLQLGLDTTFLYTTNAALCAKGFTLISEADMKRISFLATPSAAFGVFKKPNFRLETPDADFILVLDAIRDPGNMGTILRLCDWFGVPQLICTDDCVDVFNEKVVQASMGSVAGTQVFSMKREEISAFLTLHNYVVFGADMGAKSVYETNYPKKSALLLGNEGQGISNELDAIITEKITIPAAPNAKAESLNVAMAAAILLSDFARKAT